jgi:hypothetical protein
MRAGLSIGVDDLIIPANKAKMIAFARKKLMTLRRNISWDYNIREVRTKSSTLGLRRRTKLPD